KYFSGWDATLGQPSGTKAKVGIVTYDDAAYSEAVNGFLVPGLKRLGFDPMVERIGQIKTASDYSSQAAAVQNAELKFASNGVDHVIMFEANGGLSLFFMNQASSQHYHPRYGVNSSSATEYLLNAGDIQADQAKGAVGYGWIPGVDVTADRNPDSGPYSSPARRRCVKVFNDNGIKFADGNAEAVALEYCATLWLLQRALASKPSVINASTFVQGVEAIGSTFDAPGSLGETLGPGRHDGTSKIYYWRWFDDCGCLHYDGPRRTIP
ncbi:MAG: hypothetical protein QOK45_3136, partial [Mycobacterium sp.]|nr:hypothetical protein [Mycobacterium sp.]